MKENISKNEIKNLTNSPSSRLSTFMEYENISKKDLADLFGVTRQNISGILMEKSNLTLGQVKTLREKFPRLNINWLMFGDEEMFLPKQEDISTVEEKMKQLQQTIEELKKDKQHLQAMNERFQKIADQYMTLLDKKLK